jgi:hypothetical protein
MPRRHRRSRVSAEQALPAVARPAVVGRGLMGRRPWCDITAHSTGASWHVAHDQSRRPGHWQQQTISNRRLTGERGEPIDVLRPIVIVDSVSRAPWRALHDVEIQEPGHLAVRCLSLELQPERVQHLVDRPNASTNSQALGRAFEYALDVLNPIGGSRRSPESSIGQAGADKAVQCVRLSGHERHQCFEVRHKASMFERRPMCNQDARGYGWSRRLATHGGLVLDAAQRSGNRQVRGSRSAYSLRARPGR